MARAKLEANLRRARNEARRIAANIAELPVVEGDMVKLVLLAGLLVLIAILTAVPRRMPSIWRTSESKGH
jgi:hypothetical protein